MSTRDENRIIDDRGPADSEELHLAESYMYKDKPLTPRMIASLMRVDSTLPGHHGQEERERANSIYSFLYVMGVGVFALVVACGVGALFLYLHEIGPFSQTAQGVSAKE